MSYRQSVLISKPEHLFVGEILIDPASNRNLNALDPITTAERFPLKSADTPNWLLTATESLEQES